MQLDHLTQSRRGRADGATAIGGQARMSSVLVGVAEGDGGMAAVRQADDDDVGILAVADADDRQLLPPEGMMGMGDGHESRRSLGGRGSALGCAHDPRPRGADGGGAGPGADLRRGPAAGATRLPSRPRRPPGGAGGARLAGSRLYGSSRRGLERVFRQHPAPRTDEVRGSPDQRPAPAASDQDVAGSAGRGDGRAGRTQRTTRNKDEGRGTPQGGVASPLLANLYMRRFVLGWKVQGHEQRLGGSHRQLCGRLRDLLPTGPSRRGDGGDAADDGEAAVDGEREEDAAVLSCRKRRLRSWGSRSARKCLGKRAGRM